MAQTLTICSSNGEWEIRDVTGSLYGKSPLIGEVLETADRMAARLGAVVKLSTEASEHLARRRAPGE